MKKRELQQKLAALVKREREILEKAQAENRALDATEQEEYEKLQTAINETEEEIRKLDALASAIARNEQRERELSRIDDRSVRLTASQEPTAEQREMAAFSRALRSGLSSLTPEESRALQVSPNTQGGFLQAPQQWVNQLIQNVDEAVSIRPLANVMSLTQAESIGVPTLETDISDPAWTSELAVGSEDTSMAFGKRELRPHPLGKYIKVSNKLLRSSIQSIDGLVRERLAYKFSRAQNNAFLNGTGIQQPLGVFTASNDGIGTARDVSTGNTSTTIGVDGLIAAKHAIKQAYWPRLRWIFSTAAVSMIRKLKLGDGQYIWQPGINADLPARILEVPYLIDDDVPETFTTQLYVGIIGDFSKYWIVDALGLSIQILVELYALTNQSAYVARMECDGAPVVAEAFARVKLA